MKNNTELLAPAGDIEAGYAALYYGADAVYLGLQKFSARAGAVNFNENQLNQFTAYAHHLKRKVYAAINTVIQESELSELLEALDLCARCKVDGIILQDLGVARIVRESYPEMELHASTQMAVHNKEGALYLQKYGFKRVVLARELTLGEIKEIAAIPGLETEAFIHGALCYSYSGLCQFSSLEYGRSANRGKCAYPCRQCFQRAGREEHVFSMKDLALEEEVLKMPVTSLKIEGRKKSALYVAAVTDYYRRILDGRPADANRAENIKQIFARPWCKFHFNGKAKDVIDPHFVGHRGLEIGQTEEVRQGWLRFKPMHKLCRHDGLQIEIPGFEKPYGFSAKQMKVKGHNVFEAKAGEVVEVFLPPACPPFKKGQKIYLASSGAVKAAYPYEKPRPDSFKTAQELDLEITITPKKICLKYQNETLEQEGSFTPAQNPAQTEASFQNSFAKTGGTPFLLGSLKVYNPAGLFVPLSLMNDFRRKVYATLEPAYKKGVLPTIPEHQTPQKPQWLIKTDNLSCLEGQDFSLFAEIIYVLNPKAKVSDVAHLPKDKVRLALPTVCRKPSVYAEPIKAFLEAGYHKWEVGNFWALEILPKEKLDISLDTPLYMFNTEALAQARETGALRASLAVEDTLKNWQVLCKKTPLDVTFVVYQDAPLFTSAACIRENACRDCKREKKWIDLVQNKNEYKALSLDCQTMVISQKPLCFAAEASMLNPAFYRLDFLYKDYTPEKVLEIITSCIKGLDVPGCSKGNAHNQKI